jgi:hypothetical protein
MTDEGADDTPLPAGDFGTWVVEMQDAIRGARESSVPCGGCTACCTSSQFVHIAPAEKDTLAHIPAELLFPAPFMPEGHVLLGYDERGHCPMLVDNGCSIYEHRPQTCRTYDCRVFAAAGVEPDPAEGKELIAQRTRRWVFDFPTAGDRVRRGAVVAAATFLAGHPEVFGADGPPGSTGRAVLATQLHDLFVQPGAGDGAATVVTPDAAAVRQRLRSPRKSES